MLFLGRLMPKNKVPSFEEGFHELDETVEKLERGDLTLEESIRLYERGMQLADQLEKQLEDAELRVRKLQPSAAEVAETEEEFSDVDEEEA